MHFEGLLKQYLETNILLEKKEENERVYADKISSLNVALEEEHELMLSLGKKIESHELSQMKSPLNSLKNLIILGLSITLLKRK